MFKRSMHYGTRFAAALTLLTLVGIEAGYSNEAEAQVIPLTPNRVSAGSYGWGFGTRKHRTRLVTSFIGTGNDVYLHAQGYDIERDIEIVMHLNGRPIGFLRAGRNRAFSEGSLWYLPADLQRPGVNYVTFTRVRGDAIWGVRFLGVMRPGSLGATLGYLRTARGDLRHPRNVRVYLPDAGAERVISAQVYDVDTAGEVVVVNSANETSNAPTTANNRWSGPVQFKVPARNGWVEFRNTLTAAAQFNWGVRIGGVNRAFDPSAVGAFQTLSSSAWDETAVRRVLHTFAFGGHAKNYQITRWANMDPRAAIVEMLNFKQHNLLLSPPEVTDRDALHSRYASMQTIRSYLSRSGLVPRNYRDLYTDNWALGHSWTTMASVRGLNPFLHRVAQWETNYHLAVNTNAGVTAPQVQRYYDDISKVLERGLPYQYVMSTAASSAAIAMQYDHKDSRWLYDEDFCECNEDFAREYYQLFFGILGDYDPETHETVTIKNMSKILTDIQVKWSSRTDSYPVVPRYGARYHHRGALPLLPGYVSPASSNARGRLVQISNFAIEHEESLQNLPVKIIGGLADDNLDDSRKNTIRAAWRSMGSKNLLDFLRAYAISTTFHHPSRVKYWNSLERNMLLNNKTMLTNAEVYISPWMANRYRKEDYDVFAPKHNVFGGQRGTEAARSAEVFRSAYNGVTAESWSFTRTSDTESGVRWTKAWHRAAPRNAQGVFRVRDVSEWLWNQIIGDGLKNFGPLERAHVYALMGDNTDLMQLIDSDNLTRVLTAADVSTGSEGTLVNQVGSRILNIAHPNAELRSNAQRNLSRAAAFISATPYMFAQEGL